MPIYELTLLEIIKNMDAISQIYNFAILHLQKCSIKIERKQIFNGMNLNNLIVHT
jgi:hypothetical protein